MTSKILETHYQRTLAALDRSPRFSAENEADCAACDTAALHVGIDAMARIQARRRTAPQVGDAATRKPQAGCVASYPPIVRRDAETCVSPLVDALLGHRARLTGALGPLDLNKPADAIEAMANTEAWQVAVHYGNALRR